MLTRLRTGLLAVCCAFALAGCYQQQQTITVHEDGRAEIAMIVTFPSEMKDVAAAVRARAALMPELASMDLDNGICEAINAVPVADENVRVRAREIVSSKSFTCRIDIAINDFPAAIEKNGPIAALAGLASTGDRTYRYEMQSLPLSLGEFVWRGMVQNHYKEQGIALSSKQLSAIVASDKAGLTALATLVFRDASSTFTIRAPEILKTNGTLSADGTSVTFTTTMADAVSMMLEPGETETPFIAFRY